MRDPVTITAVSLLIGAGIVAAYPWIGVTALLCIGAWLCARYYAAQAPKLAEEQRLRDARVRAIVDRADHEHNLVMQGDERGMYGQYKPYC
jgi:hypothetical protein